MYPPLKDRGVDLVHVLGLLKKAAHNGNKCFEHAFHDVHDMLICNMMMMMMMMMMHDA